MIEGIMALTSYDNYMAFTGGVPPMTMGQFTIVSEEVEQAVKDYCRSNIEQATYSNIVMNAPTSFQLVLAEGPVRNANLTISFNPLANGNAASFTANDALTQYSAWMLKTDANDSGNSTSRIVLRLGQPWSINLGVPPWKLAPAWVPNVGSLLVTYTAGYAVVPKSIVAATNLAISLLWQRRTTGMPVTSRSLDGISVSYGGAPMASSVVASPGVSGLLSRYVAADKLIGWGS